MWPNLKLMKDLIDHKRVFDLETVDRENIKLGAVKFLQTIPEVSNIEQALFPVQFEKLEDRTKYWKDVSYWKFLLDNEPALMYIMNKQYDELYFADDDVAILREASIPGKYLFAIQYKKIGEKTFEYCARFIIQRDVANNPIAKLIDPMVYSTLPGYLFLSKSAIDKGACIDFHDLEVEI